MIRRILVGILSIGCMTATERAAAQDRPGPGVPLVLAEERARRVSDLRYELHFTVPSELTERVEGQATIRFRLADATRPLAFDFAASGPVRAASLHQEIPIDVGSEHVLVAPAHLREGENAISFRFTAGDAALNRNPDFMYTLFVPARARLAFPCFDQPDLKARSTRCRSTFQPDGRRWQTRPRSNASRETERPPSVFRNPIRFPLTFSPLPPGAFRSRPPNETADGSACSTAKPTRPKWPGTETRSSISTRRRSPGSSSTPPSNIHSGSSISCSFRRFSLEAWSTPVRSSTTHRGCSSTKAPPRTRNSDGPA